MSRRSLNRRSPAAFASKFLLFVSLPLMQSCGDKQSIGNLLNSPEEVNSQILDDDSSGIRLRIDIAKPEIKEVNLAGKTFSSISIDGYDFEPEAGEPQIPSKIIQVIVPAAVDLEVQTIALAATQTRSLTSDLIYTDYNPDHSATGFAVVPPKDQAYTKVYGEQAVKILDVSWAGPHRVATIEIAPFMYDAPNQKVYIRSSFDLSIQYINAQSSSKLLDGSYHAPVSPNALGAAPYIAVNGQQFLTEGFYANTPNSQRTMAVPTDLIIAHESYQESLSALINFKKEQGRQVITHFVSGKSPNEIQKMIRDEYKKETPPTHTLLVGNINQIPSWRGSGDNTWTDFNYQTLDSGNVPDLSLGRIPAHNNSELDAIITKVIAREVRPRNNDDVLLTAGKDTRLGCPVNVKRVGSKITAKGGDITLIHRLRSEGASTRDVYDSYNASPNVIVYDGHGDRRGMLEIPLLMNNLPSLTNDQYPIIFDIACLNASWRNGANVRNFAESILLQEDHGVAGLLASGGSGNGHTFFQSMGSLMAQARSEIDDLQPSVVNEVGQLIWAAKIKHGYEDRTYWNYYGDPATGVWVE